MHILHLNGVSEGMPGHPDLAALVDDHIPSALAAIPGLPAGPHDLAIHPHFVPPSVDGDVLSIEVSLSHLLPDAPRPEMALALAGGQLLVVLASFADRYGSSDAVVHARLGSEQVCYWWHNPAGSFADDADEASRLGAVELQLQAHLRRIQTQLDIGGVNSGLAAAATMTRGLLADLDMADVVSELRAARRYEQ